MPGDARGREGIDFRHVGQGPLEHVPDPLGGETDLEIRGDAVAARDVKLQPPAHAVIVHHQQFRLEYRRPGMRPPQFRGQSIGEIFGAVAVVDMEHAAVYGSRPAHPRGRRRPRRANGSDRRLLRTVRERTRKQLVKRNHVGFVFDAVGAPHVVDAGATQGFQRPVAEYRMDDDA